MDAASHADHPIKSRGGLNFTSFMHWNSTSCNSVWHAPRPCLYMDCLVLDLHREIHSHIPLHLWNQLWRSIESQHYPQTQNSTWTYRAQWNATPTCLLCVGVHMCSCVQMSSKSKASNTLLGISNPWFAGLHYIWWPISKSWTSCCLHILFCRV